MMMFLTINEIQEEFSDVTPIAEVETVDSVARIDYTADFITAYGYLRAILHSNERNTDRVLQLTAVCLRLNPANYTVWHLRRQCLDIIYQNYVDFNFVATEMTLSSTLGGENPKNYQLWYHRRALLERIVLASSNATALAHEHFYKELDYIASVLHSDGKNYHAWSHRQWVVSTIATKLNTTVDTDIWDTEIQFTKRLIEEDIRNNSAWNERWFATHHGLHTTPLQFSRAKDEIEYALSVATLDPYNESPWRYCIAILKEQQQQNVEEQKTELPSLLVQYCTRIKQIEKDVLHTTDITTHPRRVSPNLTTALIDILEFIGDTASIEEAIELATSLKNEYDTIRRKYWNLRITKLQQHPALTNP